MTDCYELLDGRVIEGLHRDDLEIALNVYRTYEPRDSRETEEGIEAMAHAVLALRELQQRRKGDDAAQDRRHAAASEHAARLQAVERWRGRHARRESVGLS